MRPSRWLLIFGIASALALAAPAVAFAQPDDDDAPEEAPEGDAGEDGDAEGDGDGMPAPPEAEPPPADVTDLEALRAEYLKLRDQLFRSRARAASVASALYSSKIRIELEYGTARFYAVDRATIRLDGANVFDDTSGSIAEDEAPRFEGFIAPGRHQVSIRIEATGKDDQRFTSVIENSFIVQAPAGHDVVVRAEAKDGGNIPYDWQRKKRGSYKLHLDVDVEAVERKQGEKKVADKK